VASEEHLQWTTRCGGGTHSPKHLEQQLARSTSIIYVQKQLSRFVSSGICCSFTRPLCAISLCAFYALHSLPMSSTGGTDLSGLHSISLYI